MGKITMEERRDRAIKCFLMLGEDRTVAGVARATGESLSTLYKWQRVYKWAENAAVYDELHKDDRKMSKADVMADAAAPAADMGLGKVETGVLGEWPGDDRFEVTDRRKVKFLRAYWGTCGSASEAARAAGIPYRTMKNWLDGDETFVEAMVLVEAARTDWVVGQLMKKIAKGDVTAIQYYLDNRKPEDWNRLRFQKPMFQLNQQNNFGPAGQQELPDEQNARDVLGILADTGLLESVAGGGADEVEADGAAADDAIHSAQPEAEASGLSFAESS